MSTNENKINSITWEDCCKWFETSEIKKNSENEFPTPPFMSVYYISSIFDLNNFCDNPNHKNIKPNDFENIDGPVYCEFMINGYSHNCVVNISGQDVTIIQTNDHDEEIQKIYHTKSNFTKMLHDIKLGDGNAFKSLLEMHHVAEDEDVDWLPDALDDHVDETEYGQNEYFVINVGY